ncbi:glycosyl hydrolase [Longispora sp. NPDC051575]|uniref:glycosyl hydrolase n=1 Tax=Longispora sp. NPDC051575 TaxID=3154943 RepID=UPI0034373655
MKPSRILVATVGAALVAGTLTHVLSTGAQADPVGAGSYTTTPAGPLPTGCGTLSTNPRQFVTANAPAGPVPTNDWWSTILFKKTDCAFGEPLHAHPVSFDTLPGGLGLSANTTPQISGTGTGVGEYHFPYVQDLQVGVAGLNAPNVKVDGWTDWTVSPFWTDGARTLRATIGHGLPFSYYQVTGGNAQLTVNAPQVWSNSGAAIGFTANGHEYAAYAPAGATWQVSGGTITSGLAGKGYFSVLALPPGDRAALATSLGRYAHNHVTGTKVAYAYNPATSNVATTYSFTTTARETGSAGTVAALYPHQWRALTGATPLTNTYVSARGTMKVLAGIGQFTTSMAFQGVLPEIPAVADNAGAERATLDAYLAQVAGNPADFRGDDTYWTGKGLGRAARIAEIADQLGNTGTRDAALNAIRTRLTDWFTASPGKTSRLFYYDQNWGTLIGYPASYGSDQELNDHHFHYGYFVAAAATLAKFDPQWATTGRYGGMVDLLIRDANNYDRGDNRFPYLRDFDIYAGHDWASGHGSFGAGNNQESSSEGMNFANALIQWGQATGNTAVRDAGVFLYTTQAAAIQEYWFDSRDANFPAAFGHKTVGMVWGDGAAYATWFSAEPEMIQGINMLPVTGGHLYLGNNPAYVRANYAELLTNNGGPPSVWQDILWEFQALGDGDAALANFRNNSGFTSEEGESKAHTFHWIRNVAALGNVDTSVTGNHPLSAVFSRNGARTYVAANITNAPVTVTFSNGWTLQVPAGRTATNGAYTWSGGSAGGGTNPTPSPTASPSPSPTPSPTGNPSTRTLHLQSNGTLGGTAPAGTAPVASAGGTNHDGVPTNASVFAASGLNVTRSAGTTTFDLFVDAGSTVANGTQVRVSYDLTGDGTWDRVETYRYFATDPAPGWEHYTTSVGLSSATGTPGNLTNGRVRLEVWNAIGNGPSTVGTGNQSVITL